MPTTKFSGPILLICTIAGTILLIYLLRGALFPFIVGTALAYMLHPIVKLLERLLPWSREYPNVSRLASIIVVYLVALAVITGSLLIIIPPAFEQATAFAESLPLFFDNAQITVEAWNEQLTGSIPEEIRQEFVDLLENAGVILISSFQDILRRMFSLVSSALTIVIGLAIVPIFLFYILKDAEDLSERFVSLFPSNIHVHVRNIMIIINHVLSNYVKAQLTLAIVVGVLAYIGLIILDIRFSILLAIVAGFSELIPIVGPIIGAIPGILVTLATDPEKIIWVILMYLIIQLLENSLMVPRIQSQALKVHPVVIMLALVVGSEFAGLYGLILGPPIVAVIKEVVYYLKKWNPSQTLRTTEQEQIQEATDKNGVSDEN